MNVRQNAKEMFKYFCTIPPPGTLLSFPLLCTWAPLLSGLLMCHYPSLKYTYLVSICHFIFSISLFFRIYLNIISSRKRHKALGVGPEPYLCISIGHLLPHSKYFPLYRPVHTTYTKESFLKTEMVLPLVIAVFLVCRE